MQCDHFANLTLHKEYIPQVMQLSEKLSKDALLSATIPVSCCRFLNENSWLIYTRDRSIQKFVINCKKSNKDSLPTTFVKLTGKYENIKRCFSAHDIHIDLLLENNVFESIFINSEVWS